MIVATTFCGLVYAIMSGQPLIILGGTGPMLIFTGILYKFCESNDIEFLPAYAWVGIWTGIILLVLAITDASCLMQYFTRFTDEVFAALISVIFVYEAVEKLIHIFHRAEQGEAIGHDVAFLSLVLAIGTYYVASSLSNLKKGESYHLDLAVVGVLIAICSVFGLPWLVAATVRSLNHVRSLATTDEVIDRHPGADPIWPRHAYGPTSPGRPRCRREPG